MFSMYGTEQVMNKSFCGKEGREGGREEVKFTGFHRLEKIMACSQNACIKILFAV